MRKRLGKWSDPDLDHEEVSSLHLEHGIAEFAIVISLTVANHDHFVGVNCDKVRPSNAPTQLQQKAAMRGLIAPVRQSSSTVCKNPLKMIQTNGYQ